MIKVLPIEGKSQLKKFVLFKINLYKGHKYAIPTVFEDEMATLNEKKNPAFGFCKMQCFLAYDQQGNIVGRIAAIINDRANETFNTQNGRFGFFDFIEDFEVAQALVDAAAEWLRKRGMQEMHGPMGFTDLDEEGMLVEGFDRLGTMATLYNHPYYVDYMNRMGFEKDVDWVEFYLKVPYPIPERIVRFAEIVEKKNNLHLVSVKNSRQLIVDGWGRKIFELINVAYAGLYGFNYLDNRQIDHYVKMYLPIIRLELISLIADKDDNLVGFGISLPSLSRAIQRSKGRMLPFGWISMFYALKRRQVDVVDLMLIAVHPDYQNKGLTAIIMNEIIGGMQKVGAKWSESNPELETNHAMQKQWDGFEREQHKRRRAYKLTIADPTIK